MKHSIKAVPGVVILLYPLLISATREPPTHSIAGVLSSDDPTQDLLHDISHGQRVEFGRDHIDQSLTPFLNQPYLAPEALDLSLGGIPTNYRKTFDGDKDLGAGGQDALADVRGSIKRPSLNWPAEDVEGDGNQIDQPTSKRPDLGLRLSSYSAQKGKEPVSSVGPSPGMTRENVWAEQNHSRRKPPFQVREREQDPKSYQQNITPAGHSIPLRPKHPSSFEGFIVNDAGLAEPSSGAKKMQEARYFGLEDLDDKIWPWISVMHPNGPKVKIDSQAQSLIMDSLIKNIPKDLQRKHSQSRTSNSGDASVPIVDFLLDESMKEFVCLLWTENLKVLHVIENESSDSIRHYAEEQTDLMKWFINFILVHQDFTSQRSIHNDDRGVPSIEEYLFYQLSKAIHSSHHENVFQVIPSFPGGSQSPILVSGKQILLNKFVLQLLGFYYKNINCIKWDHMFKKDKYFVLQVANYGRNWIEPPFLGSDQTQTSVHQSWETALPWKNPMLPTLSRNFSDDDKNLGFKYEKLVEPLGHLVASSKLDIPIKQIPDFEYLDQKTWAWISLYIVKEGAPFQQKYVLNHNLRSKIIKYVSDTIQKHLGEKENLEQELKNDLNFTERFSKLIHYIWILNSSLLEIWGYEHSDELVLNEQKSIQDYLTETFLNELEGDKNKNSRDFGDQSYFHHIWKIRFEKLIINYFLSQEQKIIYKTPDGYENDGNQIKITLEEIILTQIVAHVLSTYYKNHSTRKWKILFEQDTIMVKALLRSITVHFFTNSPAQFRFIEASKCFKLLNILPWNAEPENLQGYFSNETQGALDFLDYKPHHRILGQWLKNV